MSYFRLGCWSAILPFCLGALSPLIAAEPVITTLNLRGLQIGNSTTLVLDGTDLANARLLFPFAVKQELKPGSTDKKATIAVTLGAEVEPGYGHLRLVTDSGVSAPVVIGLDRLPQTPLAPSEMQLPIALHGTIAGGTIAETKFQGKAKQKVMVEVESQRIGGKLRPIVHLHGPDRLQVGWSWASPALHGDARLEAILPVDGQYSVTLHDAEYAAPAGSFFRLKIGDWSFADQVFPPVLTRGKGQKVELLGMANPVALDLAAAAGVEFLPLSLPKGSLWSGPRPFVRFSPHAEVVEQNSPGKPQDIPAGPVGVSGRLLIAFEEDQYRVPVVPGKKVRLEVFAERYGSSVDAALVVRNEKGDLLVRAEDSPGTLDPALEYTVPDKVTAIVVGVVDAQGRGGPRAVYHLTIDPQTTAASQESFTLFTTSQQIGLPVGGRSVLAVFAERRGYQGKIELSSQGFPAGAKLEGTTIAEGAEGTLITIQRGEGPLDASITSWRGRGANKEEQTVHLKGHPLEKLQPWMAREIAVAASAAKASDFQIDWRNLSADAGLIPGSKLALPIKVTRADAKAPVKLSLITNQITPIVNAKPDPTKQLRVEKAVELAANAADGELSVLVPPEIAAPVYDVTVQAELLSADKKTTLAIAYAPVRKIAVRSPIVVQLAANRIDVPLDPKKGATAKILGKIERRGDLKADVVLALAGLPASAKADAVTVKAGTTDFAFNVVFPPTVTAGEITGLKLSGSAVADPKQPNLRVRSQDVPLTLVLK